MKLLPIFLSAFFLFSCGKDSSDCSKLSIGHVANGEKLDTNHPLEKSMVTIYENKYFKCSATILTRNSILAAAHCFPGGKYSAVINGKTYPLIKKILYPGYSTYNILPDIAIGVLESDIPTEDFHPVTLDSNEIIPESLRVVGRSEYISSVYPDYITAILLIIPDMTRTKHLNYGAYEFIKNLKGTKKEQLRNKNFESYTTKLYRSESLNKANTTNIYFNNLVGGPTVGDSGGPVFVENKDGSFLQRGVSQFVKMNYDNQLYWNVRDYHVHDSTAFANIPYFIPWLKEKALEFNLGEIKTSKSNEKILTACEQVKSKLNQLFIEKLGINLLESTITNNCKSINQTFATQTTEAIKRCLKLCGEKDQTCKFSEDSMKTYKGFLKASCSK